MNQPTAASLEAPATRDRLASPHAPRAYGVAALAYLALAVAFTFPLIGHLTDAVPHDLGDPLLSTSILWWNAHVVPFTERWWNGLAFYPAPGFLAFSDPRLGESLLATPMQWLGLGPVTAYNLTFLLTFPLSALAAHWLGHVVTRRHDAAALAGVVYGFCPFRGAHLSHLELLAGFGMPAGLAALHCFRETGRRRWLVAFAAALVVQGYCSSYYLLFFAVLVGVWLLWFLRPSDVRALAGIVVAGLSALCLIAPLVIGYNRVHAHYGLERSFKEIVMFSADATALIAADPGLLVWGWTSRFGEREGLLFPGLTITLLVLAYGVAAWRRPAAADPLERWSRIALLLAALCAAIAGSGWLFGPWQIDVPGLKMSSDSSYKTLTIALLLFCVWLGMTTRVRQAWRRRSVFAFYTLAAALLFLCSFGPKPMFLGHEFLYKPPYAWLMNFGVFASIRVPARFGMPAMLALALAGAAAFNQCRLAPRARRVVAALLMAGVLADGWVKPLAMEALPDPWPASRAEGFTAVLELPPGDLFGDLAATYRAISHGKPTVNGTSGFEPTHYFALKTAVEDMDPTLFDWLPSEGRLLLVLDRRHPAAADWQRFLAGQPRVTPLTPDGNWLFYALAPPPPLPEACRGVRAPVTGLTFNGDAIDPSPLTDANVKTWWVTRQPQHRGDQLQFDLGQLRTPCSLEIAVGEFRRSYPRKLRVSTSEDGTAWTEVAATRTAALTIRAAIDDPTHVRFAVPLEPHRARFVRLTLDEDHANAPWHMTDVDVVTTGK